MLEITVRSSHIDMFGHVNNARYIEFLEWDRVQMTADQGIDLLAMAAEGLGPAVVRMEINYRLEARMGDILIIDSQPIEIKNDKVGVIKQTITNKKSGKIICDAVVTFVIIDLRQRKSVPMPEAMKKFFPKKS
ncbi:MAG: acyl-CoA thioesterase [Deltaproteobacteria bacterium]|nr:acyl-CoA thioesterase [Candidatus Tharpellaceae bacterium]